MLKSTKIIPNPYDEIARFEKGVFQFDFPVCRKWIEGQGKKIFGSHFKVFQEDHELLLTLLVYAIGDLESAAKRNRQNLVDDFGKLFLPKGKTIPNQVCP